MTLEKIYMPHLGEGITEATIISWYKQPGETVTQYEPLLEVITDKVTTEVPSLFSGQLKEIYYNADDVVPMGNAIALIETEIATEIKSGVSAKEIAADTAAVKLNTETPLAPRYSPSVLALAQTHELDLKQLTGSGQGGRITRKDVLAYVAQTESQKSQAKVKLAHDLETDDKEETTTGMPVSPVRQAIARNLSQSYQEIPHAWTMIEVDGTNLVKLREAKKTEFKQQEGYNLTYLAFIIKTVAQALRKYPILNSRWSETEIIYNQEINISIAVAANNLLFVPVIKRADEKSVKGIAREIAALATKAKNNELTAEDSQGGTFTVNSTGSYGSILSQGIINHPQVAILQVESIVKRPMFYREGIAIRDMLNLCLSIDHRVLDGLDSGKFLAEVKQQIESIEVETFNIY